MIQGSTTMAIKLAKSNFWASGAGSPAAMLQQPSQADVYAAKTVLEEHLAMQGLQHPGIVPYHGIVADRLEIGGLYSLAAGGTVSDFTRSALPLFTLMGMLL